MADKVTYIDNGELSVGRAGTQPSTARVVDSRSYASNGRVFEYDPASGVYNTPGGAQSTTQSFQQVAHPAEVGAPPVAPTSAVPTQPINTGQPNPNTVNATPYTGNSIVDALSQAGQPSSFNDRANLASKAGIAGYTGTADQNKQLLSRYQQGFNNASGPAPQNSPEGRSGVAGLLPAKNDQNDAPLSPESQQVVTEDPYFKQLSDKFNEINTYQADRPSLVSEYQNLLKSSGIQDVDAQLMDINKVIEGSEDDIRTEVTKAGGFATDSQVMALAANRQKPLISKYNSLVQLRQQKADYLDTSLKLTMADRDSIDKRMAQSLDFAKLIADHGEKMQSAAKENYRFVIQQSGFGGLAQTLAGDPYQQSLVEKTLGLAKGSLSNSSFIASADAERNLNIQSKLSSLATDKLQRANINSQISQREKDAQIQDLSQSESLYQQLKTRSIDFNTLPAEQKKQALSIFASKGETMPRTLTTTEKTAQNSAISGLNAISQLKQLNSSSGLPLLRDYVLGDTVAGRVAGNSQFTNLKKEAADVITRIRTGAALNESEVKFYQGQLPAYGDKPEDITRKLNQLEGFYLGMSGVPVKITDPKTGQSFESTDLYDPKSRLGLRQAIDQGFTISY